MFIDARRIADQTVLETDICIVGAGAAGITLARQFIGQPFRVCLLESGGLRMTRATQRLYGGESVGLPYELDTTRSRFFGGSTNCWGGFCRPFEDHHFAYRDWVPDSGWPIRAADLRAYYERAHQVCGLDSRDYDAERRLRAVEGEGLQPLPLATDRLQTSIAQLNKDRRLFGKAFRDELGRAPNVTVCLHANVVELKAGEDARCIETLRVATLAGNGLHVRSQIFVLASGAIENARLLLASNTVDRRGLGNRYDRVGRYFMEHPTQAVAEIDMAEAARRWFKAYVDRYAVLRWPVAAEINVSYAVQKDERLLDSAAHIEFVLDGEKTEGAAAAKRLYRDAWRGTLPPDPAKHVGAILKAPLSVATFAWGLFSCSERLVRSRGIAVSTEQSPNPDSRVTLAADRDPLGLPRVRLDWRLNQLDHDSMQRTARIIEDELRRAGLLSASRRLTEPEAPRWNWHQMGTTRMHEDPKRGVADAHCRVHGIANLFVAGSSVFPTAGNHTPTLTIIALAIRLGDHICSTISRGNVVDLQDRTAHGPAAKAGDFAAAWAARGGLRPRPSTF
jgi:choline dehydrogenase-like flavoprotein